MLDYQQPDVRGHFGKYGGSFVSETLTHAINELKAAYARYQHDPQFVAGVPEISDGPQPNGQGQAEGDRRPGAASRSPLRGIRVICQRFPGLYSRKSCI